MVTGTDMLVPLTDTEALTVCAVNRLIGGSVQADRHGALVGNPQRCRRHRRYGAAAVPSPKSLEPATWLSVPSPIPARRIWNGSTVKVRSAWRRHQREFVSVPSARRPLQLRIEHDAVGRARLQGPERIGDIGGADQLVLVGAGGGAGGGGIVPGLGQVASTSICRPGAERILRRIRALDPCR